MSAVMQLLAVLSWLLVIKFLQITIWPWLKDCFGELAYGTAYPVSILLFTLITWYFGLLHIPIQIALIPFLALLAYTLRSGQFRDWKWKRLAKWDLAFILPFVFLLEVRYMNPSISFAEKFMDHAFLASIIRLPLVPPLDPWFVGGTLDVYYYLGHWMMGTLAIVSGVSSSVAFNLILPTVLGLAAVSLYSLGHLLLKRHRWFPVLTLFLVDPAFFAPLFAGSGASTVLWESTRVISNTINEYPLFSFLWGDPHAHVISLFNQAFLLFALIYAYMRWNDLSERGRWLLTGCTVLSLGSMPLLNSWDVLVYAPVVLAIGAAIWWRKTKNSCDGAPWRMALLVPVLAVLLYAPYYFHLQTQGINGVGLVSTPTDPVQFILVYGFFIVIFLLECRKDIQKRPVLLALALPLIITGYGSLALAVIPLVYLILRKRFFPEVPAILGLGLISLLEIIYLKDNMGESYYRMNTVFKFSLIAWMMMGISALAMIGSRLEQFPAGSRDKRIVQRLAALAAILIIIAPFVLPDLDYGHGSRSLDGLSYLEGEHPGDAAAIQYLLSLEEDISIVEAEGGDYSYYSRVSSSTGIPTVIGMPFHEQMWRGDEGDIGRRMADVRIIYENPDQTVSLMHRYNITHLFLGESERERYRVSIPVDALQLIYDEKGVKIYRLPA
jgi:YYY domain-containing protein